MSHEFSKRIPRSRPSSPVHVFVDKDTPVHVYMRKGENDQYNSEFNQPRSNSVKASKMKRPRKPGSNIPTSKLMRNSNERVRSMSPPWVPPPGKTTKTGKPCLGSYWNEEEAEFSQQDRYEQQINELQDELGELREQLKTEKEREQIRNSEDTIQCQDEKIEELKQEIDVMEKENHILRDSLGNTRSNLNLFTESDKLIQMLIEAELTGERCAHQMQHVSDYLKNIIKEGHKITNRDVDRISTQFHDTESRLFEFKSVNNALRDLLKDAQQREINGQNSLEKDKTFLSKIRKELEDSISKLELELFDKDKVIDDLRKQLASKNDETINFASTHESLENVKGHLQQQLKQRSGDLNRMSVQIRTLESELAKERLDKEHLIELFKNPKDHGLDDRDVLKKAARAQKQRALKAEETIQELTSILTEKERHIEHLISNQKENDTKSNIKPVNKSFNNQFVQCEINSREDQDNLRRMDEIIDENQHLHRKIVSNDHEDLIITLKRENESLRSIADQCESRLRDVEREMKTLRRTMAEENDDQNDDQVNKLSKILEKLETSEKSNQTSQIRIEDLEKKIKSLESQNFEMKTSLQLKDGNVIDNKCKTEELIRENASLTRQLEAALTDSRRNADNTREKTVGKDRQLQSRIHESESQLAQQRAEANKWRRNGEEIERKCNAKLQDLKIQLEQSEITNRSMQTYVQFLKKSYANVFGDIPLSNGLSCPNPPYIGQSLNFGGF